MRAQLTRRLLATAEPRERPARNAFAHGGRWHFTNPLRASVQWRNIVLTQEMDGTDVEGVVSLYDIAQLAADLTLLVDPPVRLPVETSK